IGSFVPSPACGGGTGRGHASKFAQAFPLPNPPRKRGRKCTESAAALFNSRQPSMQIGAHERIVVEVRIGGADAVDLLALSGSQRLLRVETPDAFEQSLPAQDLVAAGDHALETVGRVEDRRVAVGDLRVERHKLGVNLVGGNGSVNVLQQFDRALDPYAPM